jgi:hypothetical protein
MPANQIIFFFLNKSFSFAYVQFLCFWHWLNFLVSIPVPQIKLCGRRRRSVMCLTGEFSPDGIWWLVVMRAHTFRMFNESFQNWQFPFLYSMESVKPNKHTKPIEILESFFFFFFSQRIENEFHRYYNWVLYYYNMISCHLANLCVPRAFSHILSF